MFLFLFVHRCPTCSVTFVLLLIKYYGATNTEIVKSLRKVLSIALSFAIYPKPVNSRYLGGMAATCASLVMSYKLKRNKVRLRWPARSVR
jgi:adenosine 3'-phospho 5'-phosphosulfate transporter B3